MRLRNLKCWLQNNNCWKRSIITIRWKHLFWLSLLCLVISPLYLIYWAYADSQFSASRIYTENHLLQTTGIHALMGNGKESLMYWNDGSYLGNNVIMMICVYIGIMISSVSVLLFLFLNIYSKHRKTIIIASTMSFMPLLSYVIYIDQFEWWGVVSRSPPVVQKGEMAISSFKTKWPTKTGIVFALSEEYYPLLDNYIRRTDNNIENGEEDFISCQKLYDGKYYVFELHTLGSWIVYCTDPLAEDLPDHLNDPKAFIQFPEFSRVKKIRNGIWLVQIY